MIDHGRFIQFSGMTIAKLEEMASERYGFPLTVRNIDFSRSTIISWSFDYLGTKFRAQSNTVKDDENGEPIYDVFDIDSALMIYAPSVEWSVCVDTYSEKFFQKVALSHINRSSS